MELADVANAYRSLGELPEASAALQQAIDSARSMRGQHMIDGIGQYVFYFDFDDPALFAN